MSRPPRTRSAVGARDRGGGRRAARPFEARASEAVARGLPQHFESRARRRGVGLRANAFSVAEDHVARNPNAIGAKRKRRRRAWGGPGRSSATRDPRPGKSQSTQSRTAAGAGGASGGAGLPVGDEERAPALRDRSRASAAGAAPAAGSRRRRRALLGRARRDAQRLAGSVAKRSSAYSPSARARFALPRRASAPPRQADRRGTGARVVASPGLEGRGTWRSRDHAEEGGGAGSVSPSAHRSPSRRAPRVGRSPMPAQVWSPAAHPAPTQLSPNRAPRQRPYPPAPPALGPRRTARVDSHPTARTSGARSAVGTDVIAEAMATRRRPRARTLSTKAPRATPARRLRVTQAREARDR